jgi:ubiquinone/menaquinone biosynthesis C-methylase UbiE
MNSVKPQNLKQIIMVKPRIKETDQGISGEFTVELYNIFQRNFRDKGILATDRIIKSGISRGHALEIGPGPGYLGLEWLRKTHDTKLTGVEISNDMINISERNTRDYGLEERTSYVAGDAGDIPFPDKHFDAVFTNGSLHEWSDPVRAFSEIHRVLVPGGRFFVSDLRRDVSPPVRWFMYSMTQPEEIRPGFLASVKAAYIKSEIRELIRTVNFREIVVSQNLFGLQITGSK